MKRLVMLILICSMIGIPVNAVNPEIPVAVHITAEENEVLMKGYLERELRKLDGIKVVSEWQDAKWQINIIAVELRRADGSRAGLTIAAISLVRIRYIEPYLKTTITKELREWLAFIPEYQTTLVATDDDLKELCERIIVGVEADILQ